MDFTTKRGTRLARGLGALQVFIGLGAVAGGCALVLDPTGGVLGIPLALLEGTPFRDYLVPGLVLLLVNGVGSLVGAWACFYQQGFAGVLATGLGIFLMLWIVLQVWWIGFSWVHLLYFVLGLIEARLGLALLCAVGSSK